MADYTTFVLEENELDFWDDFIVQSETGTIFHKIEWLNIAAEHAEMKFIPLAVKKGNDIVCLFPVFLRKKYGLRILLSPPNRCGVSYLGPALKIRASNRYNYEWTFINIVNELIRYVEKKIGFDYFRILHVPGMLDMRPYVWKGYSVQAKFTYKFDLSRGNEQIYNGFNNAAKKELRKALNNNNLFISRNLKHAYSILSLAGKIFSEQNIRFRISDEYFKKLINSSFSNNIECLAVLDNRRPIAGSINLTDRSDAYVWVAAVNKGANIPGVGELVLWERIKDYHSRGIKYFDNMDANFERLCKHKARYGANLVNYFGVQKKSVKGMIAFELMKLSNKRQVVS